MKFLQPIFKDPQYKPIWPLLKLNYQTRRVSVLADGSEVEVEEGVRQGVTESSNLFEIALKTLTEAAGQYGVQYLSIIDDIFMVIERRYAHLLGDIFDHITKVLADWGLVVKPGKTQIWCQPDVEIPHQWKKYYVNEEARCLGARLSSTGNTNAVVTTMRESRKRSGKLQTFQ